MQTYDVPDTQVLAVIQAVGLPKPIEDVCPEPVEQEEPAPVKETKTLVQKNKAMKKRSPEKENLQVAATANKAMKKRSLEKENLQVAATAINYVAGDFNGIFSKFVREQKAQGVSHRDALKNWKESDVRSELLKGMSLSEKTKRRFVD